MARSNFAEVAARATRRRDDKRDISSKNVRRVTEKSSNFGFRVEYVRKFLKLAPFGSIPAVTQKYLSSNRMELCWGMARQRRFQYPGAVYHIMARGDGGKTVFETVNHKRQKQSFQNPRQNVYHVRRCRLRTNPARRTLAGRSGSAQIF